MVYVDGNLSADVTDGKYSIANRDDSGFDGIAFKTLNDALTAVAVGGKIYIRSGTYAELGQSDVCFPIDKNLTIQPYIGEVVTLTYPAGNPPLVGAGEYGQIIKFIGADVILDGLTIIGTRDEGDSASQDLDISVWIDENSQGTIKNCTLQKWSHCAVKFGEIAGNLVIESNKFESGGFTGRDHHIYDASTLSAYTKTIRHNSMSGASGYAIHLYSAPQNCNIYGNVIFGNGGTYSPQGGGGILIGGSNHVVVNNTIEANTGYGGIVFYKDGGSNTVKNNIIRNTVISGGIDGGDITADDMAETNSVGYNNKITEWHGSWPDNYQPGATDLNVDPQYAITPQDTWDDYRLTDPDSPMIDAGVDVGADYIAILDPAETDWPTPKNQGAARDIGAFTT